MKLAIGTFGGVSAFPLLVAQETGRFAEADLDIEVMVTRDSGSLREGLETGELAIAHLAPDNVIAWADDAAPVRAWLGGSAGPISLLARDAEHIRDLRGRRIAVDSPRSGFTPILRQLLRTGDVDPADVELVATGATRLRFAALQGGAVDATMLTLPWSTLAAASGLIVLGDHLDVAPALLTSCAASLTAWLAHNEAIAAPYALAIDAAVAWIREPAHHAEAAAMLAADMRLEPSVATVVLATMLDQRRGWPKTVNLKGIELRPTWTLRAESMGAPTSPPEAYVQVLQTP